MASKVRSPKSSSKKCCQKIRFPPILASVVSLQSLITSGHSRTSFGNLLIRARSISTLISRPVGRMRSGLTSAASIMTGDSGEPLSKLEEPPASRRAPPTDGLGLQGTALLPETGLERSIRLSLPDASDFRLLLPPKRLGRSLRICWS